MRIDVLSKKVDSIDEGCRMVFPRLLSLVLAYAIASFAQADCNKKIDLSVFQKRGMVIHEFTAEEELKFQRYVNITQGSPPHLATYPNHKIYFFYQKSSQLCDASGNCTPAAQGAIALIWQNCVIFELSGAARTLNKVVNGTWSIPTE